LRYNFPEGERKRYKIGDRELDTRQFWYEYLYIFTVFIEHIFVLIRSMRLNMNGCWQ